MAACITVFTILQFIKQPQGNRSWRKSIWNWAVAKRTFFSIVLFCLLFILYVIFVLQNYRVIAITEFEKNLLVKITDISKKETLKKLSSEIQLIIGEQYSVKIDDNVKQGNENSRLIIVPGIFQNEKALETLIKLADEGLGTTLLPYLHTLDLKENDKLKLRHFKEPKPAREVSLIFPKNDPNIIYLIMVIP